jgi:biotin synthase-related radical SAM superfamily protein
MRRVSYVPDKVLVQAVASILDEVAWNCDVALGGGTPTLSDYRVEYYSNVSEAIKQRGSTYISLEIVPPKTSSGLERIRSAGVDSVIMSLEIWNDGRRRTLCSGKSEVSKSRYFEAWSEAIHLFGRGQVSSVLLVGLEPEKSTKEAIRALIDVGVIPTLIPFRPYGACEMAEHPLTDHELYLRCSALCGDLLAKADLRDSDQRGCTGCGGCSTAVIQENRHVAGAGFSAAREMPVGLQRVACSF